MSDDILDFSSTFKSEGKLKKQVGLKPNVSSIDKENVVNTLKPRIEYVDKDKKGAGMGSKTLSEDLLHQSEEVNRLKQELRLAHEKNSLMAQEQRESKGKWQLERSELEAQIVQLTAQQTQLVGTIRKKDADFERLQVYLHKSQSMSQRSAPGPHPGLSIALVVTSGPPPVPSVTTGASSNVGLVISKPLPSSSLQAQQIQMQVVRDATVQSLTQLLRESQAENESLRSQLEITSKNDQSDSIATNEPTVLQKRVMELERHLALSHSHAAALKEKAIADAAALQSTSVGVKRDLEASTLQLQRAEETIRAQEALLRQALSTTTAAETTWTVADHYEAVADDVVSPPAKKSRVSTDGEDALTDLFQLPPASPATVQLLRECGWAELPPLEAENNSEASL